MSLPKSLVQFSKFEINENGARNLKRFNSHSKSIHSVMTALFDFQCWPCSFSFVVFLFRFCLYFHPGKKGIDFEFPFSCLKPLCSLFSSDLRFGNCITVSGIVCVCFRKLFRPQSKQLNRQFNVPQRNRKWIGFKSEDVSFSW